MKSTGKLIVLFLTFLALAASAYAQSPREQLQQMVEQLQKTPSDNALRERIIKLAPTLKPSPALPPEAERRMARGSAAFAGATSVADYQVAVKEFEQATLAAPWYGDTYFNLGVAQDKAGNYEAALRSLKLAQLASHNSKEIGIQATIQPPVSADEEAELRSIENSNQVLLAQSSRTECYKETTYPYRTICTTTDDSSSSQPTGRMYPAVAGCLLGVLLGSFGDPVGAAMAAGCVVGALVFYGLDALKNR